MLLNILRWLQGYVCFRITGRFPERFINIVTKSGLSIWNTGRSDTELCACMYVRDYKAIRPLARKSSVRLKVTKKVGMPFFIRRYKNRVGVLGGIAVFAAVVFVMSNFIWTVEITGLQTISEAKLRAVLRDNGLYIGTYIPNSSFKIIERDTMLEVDDIGWMSINVIGSHASVEIKEKAKSPDVDNYHQPANVKAKRDGFIIRINVAEGESLFISGSAVVKDQLLVSSVVENQLGGVTLVRANAEVIAETEREVSFVLDKSLQRFNFDEPLNRYTFNAFGLEVPLSFVFTDDSEHLVRYKTESAVLFDTFLPLSKSTQSLYRKSLCKEGFTEKQAQRVLNSYAALYECFELSECIIKDRSCELLQTDSQYVMKANYTCEEDIAYQQDINIDNADTEKITPTESKKIQ